MLWCPGWNNCCCLLLSRTYFIQTVTQLVLINICGSVSRKIADHKSTEVGLDKSSDLNWVNVTNLMIEKEKTGGFHSSFEMNNGFTVQALKVAVCCVCCVCEVARLTSKESSRFQNTFSPSFVFTIRLDGVPMIEIPNTKCGRITLQ